MHQNRWRLGEIWHGRADPGFAPESHWGSLQRPPDLLTGLRGPTSKGRGGEGGTLDPHNVADRLTPLVRASAFTSVNRPCVKPTRRSKHVSHTTDVFTLGQADGGRLKSVQGRPGRQLDCWSVAIKHSSAVDKITDQEMRTRTTMVTQLSNTGLLTEIMCTLVRISY